MDPDLDALDAGLGDLDADGYLIDEGSYFADQRYLSGFDAERFLTLYTPGETALLVPGLEYARAKQESRADTVRRFSDYDYTELREEEGRSAARRAIIDDFVSEFDVESVVVPRDFPLQTADGLRTGTTSVRIDEDDLVGRLRATKTDAEIEYIKKAQGANERAMARAEELLARATVEDGTLQYEDEPVTSERLKEEIEITLLRNGCSLDQTIVACGADGAEPHNRGSGPITVNDPIVVDIFPKDTATKYHADMTRTFLIGTADEAVREFHDLTLEAMEAAFEVLEGGVTGEEVHNAVCDVYEEAGYPTLRTDDGTQTGFIHSTGHGVGLDVHELPRVAEGGEELQPGHVVTIEPGLYDPDVGGVRVEDLVVVTEDGYENLTDYHRDLVV
jgi:Xaa-Pro aminopeptidase